MKNIMHRARLKNILEELVVANGPASLYFQHPSYPLLAAWASALKHFNILPLRPNSTGTTILPSLDFPSQPEIRVFPVPGEVEPSRVTILADGRARVDGVSQFLEKCDDENVQIPGAGTTSGNRPS